MTGEEVQRSNATVDFIGQLQKPEGKRSNARRKVPFSLHRFSTRQTKAAVEHECWTRFLEESKVEIQKSTERQSFKDGIQCCSPIVGKSQLRRSDRILHTDGVKVDFTEFHGSTPCQCTQMARAAMINRNLLGTRNSSFALRRSSEPPRCYRFTPVCHATAIIMFTQISTGMISAVAVLVPNIVRSIPLLA